jgi:hypothetical protein
MRKIQKVGLINEWNAKGAQKVLHIGGFIADMY